MAQSGVEFAKPFVKATTSVLSTMAMTQPKPGKPYVKKDETATGDVSAIIGFTGEKNGTISVSFSKKCAVAMVKAMLGDDIEDIIQDAKDAVGEITNMISGQARAGLAEMGMTFQGSTPTVVMGDKHTISHVTKGPVIVIPFTTDHGDFSVEFSFEQG
jgi:chemotaxis protein CheX